jgi:hypothetical protein
MPAIDPALLDCRQALAIVDRDGGTVGSITKFYLDRATPPDLGAGQHRPSP